MQYVEKSSIIQSKTTCSSNTLLAFLMEFATWLDHCSFESKITPSTFMVLLEVFVAPFSSMLIGCVPLIKDRQLRLRLIYPQIAKPSSYHFDLVFHVGFHCVFAQWPLQQKIIININSGLVNTTQVLFYNNFV